MDVNYTIQVSIVIPLLEQKPSWIEQSVSSALTQTIPCDVIVVMSHDTPPSNRDVLTRLQKKHSRLDVLTSPIDCGYACSINLGIKRATTERLGFLLADDWLQPNAVESCLRSEADIISTRMAIYTADGQTLLETSSTSNSELALREDLHEKAQYLGHFLLFNREKLLEVGGVDTRVGSTGPDDFDLLWTLLERGARARIIEAPLYNYRDHTESWRLSLRPPSEQLVNLEKIFDKHGLSVDLRPSLREAHGRWYGKSIAQVRRGDTL